MNESRPTWWVATQVDPPEEWIERFNALAEDTCADRYGLRAGVFIARVRRRTGAGPSFSEMFTEVLQGEPLHPAWPEGLDYAVRAAIQRSYRLHVAVVWKRRGWISWTRGVTRSLRVGITFRERSLAHHASSKYPSQPRQAEIKD